MESSPKSFDPQILARIEGLHLRARHIVEGFVAGLHRSPYQGYSIEFAEHREYAPGDDLRYLDWKAFGRTDKLYLKQFEDETNLQCMLIVDVSESMRFKSEDEPLSKYEYAQCIAASLAWLVLRQQDAVGLATFDDQLRSFQRPTSSPDVLKQIIQVLESAEPKQKTSTGPIFHDLAERISKRCVVIVISDLFDDCDSMLAGLKHFRHRRHDAIVLQIMDSAELDFPFRKSTLFRGMEQMGDLLVEPHALRRAYQNEVQQFMQKLQRGCQSHGMDYQLFTTNQPLDLALSGYLSAREQRVR